MCSETRKGCIGCLHGNFQLKTRAMRQCCWHRYIIDSIDYSPNYHEWFLSVVVITFALHAKGPGFKPRRNLWITFLLLEFFFFFLQNSSCQKFLSGVSSVFLLVPTSSLISFSSSPFPKFLSRSDHAHQHSMLGHGFFSYDYFLCVQGENYAVLQCIQAKNSKALDRRTLIYAANFLEQKLSSSESFYLTSNL